MCELMLTVIVSSASASLVQTVQSWMKRLSLIQSDFARILSMKRTFPRLQGAKIVRANRAAKQFLKCLYS